MVFSSVLFLFYFMPVAFSVYYLVPRRYKNLTLLILSLIFYSWGDGNRGGIQTSEVIWPEFQLPNDGSATINYSILIFPGLEQLNGIIGKTGIEIKDGKLTASFAADEAERIITFFYKTADGSENSATVKLPSGKAGSIQVLSMPWNDRIIEAAWQIGQSPKQPLFLP